jgi:hypothetical protein
LNLVKNDNSDSGLNGTGMENADEGANREETKKSEE